VKISIDILQLFEKKTRSHATVSWMAILSMGEHMVAAMNLLSNGQYPPKTTRLKPAAPALPRPPQTPAAEAPAKQHQVSEEEGQNEIRPPLSSTLPWPEGRCVGNHRTWIEKSYDGPYGFPSPCDFGKNQKVAMNPGDCQIAIPIGKTMGGMALGRP